MNISNYLDAIAKPFQGIAPWILRLVLGTSFILHGYGKFPLPPERMVRMFESGGMPAPDVVASMVAIGEVAAGSAVILGGLLGAAGHLVTRLGGGAVVVIMTGAFYLAHSDWFITPKLFMSEQIFIFALGLYFAIKGNN
ncbi:DoxX family protein [Gammaproteobacteria bacterium]|jgi:putative oxidoreductase|nr:DoxX family protein [bacterium]MDA9068978.1 DoxX family protein [Gammaproteobacteria bacterium]MDA9078909.1 DoxX family protein [Gammaproteobacteria bacterium]MDA9954999.1 DoxX family protein [Gammaproteobacteria bacterium]MDB0070464.1 DoxX family protein [Gammaproteobacteria bacterium]